MAAGTLPVVTMRRPGALLGAVGASAIIYGGDGNDTLVGGNRDDCIEGEAGNDTIQGWYGTEALYGGEGDDVLGAARVNDGTSTMYGGPGADHFTGDTSQVADLEPGEAIAPRGIETL
jgi:Ca2+-binding RTX toxin-like protein